MQAIKAYRWTTVLAVLAVSAAGCAQTRSLAPGWPISRHESSHPLIDKQAAREVQRALARTLESQGDLETAAEAYHRILDADPKDAASVHRLAIVQDRLGQHREAEELFHRALKLQRRNPNILSDLGYSYCQQERWDEAEISLRQALKWDPEHPQAHSHLGLVLCRQGHPTEAFEEFLMAGCTAAQAQLNVASACAAQGDLGDARLALRLALAADPNAITVAEGDPRLARLLPNEAEPLFVAAAPGSEGADEPYEAEESPLVAEPQYESPVVVNMTSTTETSGAQPVEGGRATRGDLPHPSTASTDPHPLPPQVNSAQSRISPTGHLMRTTPDQVFSTEQPPFTSLFRASTTSGSLPPTGGLSKTEYSGPPTAKLSRIPLMATQHPDSHLQRLEPLPWRLKRLDQPEQELVPLVDSSPAGRIRLLGHSSSRVEQPSLQSLLAAPSP